MLFANLDVTTHSLTWLIILLADHEAEQNRLRAEVQANSSRLIDYLDARDSFLHLCFLEAMRVRPMTSEGVLLRTWVTFG